MLRIVLACLAFAGCSVAPRTYATRDDISAERREDAVKRMQDEFNQATGDAY